MRKNGSIENNNAADEMWGCHRQNTSSSENLKEVFRENPRANIGDSESDRVLSRLGGNQLPPVTTTRKDTNASDSVENGALKKLSGVTNGVLVEIIN